MGQKELKWGTWFLVVGGIVWGLVGLGYFLKTNLNIINLILGGIPIIENLLYIIVGVCAVSVAYYLTKQK